jgi:hypothetical protein
MKASAYCLLADSDKKRHRLTALFDKEHHTLCEGSLGDVTEAMLNNGFEMDEIEFAVLEMEKHNHDVAQFGVFNKMFLFTTVSDKNKLH